MDETKTVSAIESPVNPVIGETDQLLFLLPEEITIEDSMDVRPYSSKMGLSEKETEAIGNLAATIEAEGQILPVKVRYNESNGYTLVDGKRRVSAIGLINAGKSAKELPLRVRAIVVKDTETKIGKILGHAHRQSMIANIHRVDFSPMDMAMDIELIRGKYKWVGNEGTKKVAEYLKVSPATIIQHEKLLKLDEDTQKQVHEGKISRDAAFVMVGVDPAKRKEVLAKAEELKKAEAETVKESKKEEKAKDSINKVLGKDTAKDASSKTTKRNPKKTDAISARHVKAAVRETGAKDAKGEAVKPIARTKKEIMEFFDSMEGPASGYPDGAAHKFIREIRAYSNGASSDRKIERAWMDLIEKAPKGTKASIKD